MPLRQSGKVLVSLQRDPADKSCQELQRRRSRGWAHCMKLRGDRSPWNVSDQQVPKCNAATGN